MNNYYEPRNIQQFPDHAQGLFHSPFPYPSPFNQFGKPSVKGELITLLLQSIIKNASKYDRKEIDLENCNNTRFLLSGLAGVTRDLCTRVLKEIESHGRENCSQFFSGLNMDVGVETLWQINTILSESAFDNPSFTGLILTTFARGIEFIQLISPLNLMKSPVYTGAAREPNRNTE